MKTSVSKSVLIGVFLCAVLLLVAGLWVVRSRRLISPPASATIQPATPEEIANAQAAYDRVERNSVRGDCFYLLADALDRTRRGAATEREIIERLGPPDGVFPSDRRRLLVYYYNRFGNQDWFAMAEFQDGVLLQFGYNGTPTLPPAKLLPFEPLIGAITQPDNVQPPAGEPKKGHSHLKRNCECPL
jgi:hypothetical protein